MSFGRLGALAAVVAAAAVWALPPALAEPPPPPDPVTDPAADTAADAAPVSAPPAATTLALTDLGANPTISFGRMNRDNANTSVTFAVPRGLVPVALRARLDLPVTLRFGNVSVNQGDRTISRIGLPPQDGADIVIPLDGVQLSGDFVTLNLRMVALSQDPYCWDNDAPIRFADASISFDGAETAPRSVAEFLPPVLRRVVIAIPARPSLAESTAAVRVATAVAGRNSQKIDIVVVPLPEGGDAVDLPPAPLEREIVVREGPEKGLALQAGSGLPTLVISGRADELPEQVQLLTNDMVRFAAGAKSASGSLIEEQLLPNTTTLAAMDESGVVAQGTAVIDLNQTKFGEPLRNIRVHLIGSYTPLPGSYGGEVSVGVDGKVIDRWPTTADGVIDKTVTIPDRLVDRAMSLQVSVRTVGDQGDCYRVSTPLRIDGSTEIVTDGANPPLPQGFQSLPQALMPNVRIGIGPDAFGDTARAARIMVGFQRVSAVPLLTRVTTLEEALGSGGSAVLVSAGGWTQPSLVLPFTAGGGQVNVQGLGADGRPAELTLDQGSRFGSLQTIFDGSRALLVATSNGAPEQLDGLLDWLAAERGRWADLDGSAIIAMPDAEPVTIANPPSGLAPSAGGSSAAASVKWWVIGGAAAVAAAIAVGLLRR